ncbi:D-alanyl-D-alanine carboxypeptidase [Candidatus Uhrbacteria bacterium]|nr:D-alanyl-D-alanine carboxypeptidase [Candidatus Uhrbacteria bacterium]
MKFRLLFSIGCLLVSGGFFYASFASAGVVSSTDAVPFVPVTNEFASAMVMIPGTHQVLYSFKPDHARVAASLTKLVGALTLVKLNPAWERVVALSRADEVGGGRLRVSVGTRIKLIDLLYSSITASANNAAMALARTSKVGTRSFLLKMNQVAKDLGANHSHFLDASGMSVRNMTTARDMALIAEQAFRDPIIHAAASTAEYQFPIQNTKQLKIIKTTNPLLVNDAEIWVRGGKTGYLEESKYNFLVELQPMQADGTGDHNKDLIIVVMGAPTKQGSFDAAKRLADWAWNNHEFHSTLARP